MSPSLCLALAAVLAMTGCAHRVYNFTAVSGTNGKPLPGALALPSGGSLLRMALSKRRPFVKEADGMGRFHLNGPNACVIYPGCRATIVHGADADPQPVYLWPNALSVRTANERSWAKTKTQYVVNDAMSNTPPVDDPLAETWRRWSRNRSPSKAGLTVTGSSRTGRQH